MASRALVARLARLAVSCAGIGDDRPDRHRQIERNLDVLVEQATQQAHGFIDQFVDVDPFRLQRLASRERQQAAGQVGAAPCRVKRFANEVGQRRVAGGQFPCQFQIAADDGQQIVEVVRHATGQVADRFHFLRLPKLILGGLVRRDIDAKHRDPAIGHATFVDEHPATAMQPVFDRSLWVAMRAKLLGEPFFFAADRIDIMSLGQPRSQHVFNSDTGNNVAGLRRRRAFDNLNST